MDKDLVREIAGQFSKPELLEVAKELDLESKSTDQARNIIRNIISDLDKQGIPDEEECSDLMYEFLVAAEFIEVEEEEEPDEVEPIKLPECFGFEDNKDPACGKCRVKDQCIKERTANRPECFGLLFSKNAEECRVCLEASFCAIAMNGG